MAEAFNLHRFGMDEFAVKHLINGTFSDDDQERWQIMEAPEYHIRRLFGEHRRAQAALKTCGETGAPFVLYLRSFGAEFRGQRDGQAIGAQFSMQSVLFQNWLAKLLGDPGPPLIRLHGGSDGFYSGGGEPAVLSTDGENWEGVATELIGAAGVIVILISDLSPGVRTEITRIREMGRAAVCLIVILARGGMGGIGVATATVADPDGIMSELDGFPHVFEMRASGNEATHPTGLAEKLASLMSAARTSVGFPKSIAVRFTYLEPGFTQSELYEKGQRRIWRIIRALRITLDRAYWSALDSRKIEFRHLDFGGAWKLAHQAYGIAIATADFQAIDEALSALYSLYLRRNADFALVIPSLAGKLRTLATEILGGPPPKTEDRFGEGVDLMSFPRRTNMALDLVELAGKQEQENPDLAGDLYFAALIYALTAEDAENDVKRKWISAQIANDWSSFQFRTGFAVWAILNLEFANRLFHEVAEADRDKYACDLARSYHNLGKRYSDLGEVEKSEAAYKAAIDLRHRIGVASAQDRVSLFETLSSLGWVYGRAKRPAEAKPLFDEALELCRAHMAETPEGELHLIRLLAWKSEALVQSADFADEARQALGEAKDRLARATGLAPDIRMAGDALLEQASAVVSKVPQAERNSE